MYTFFVRFISVQIFKINNRNTKISSLTVYSKNIDENAMFNKCKKKLKAKI